MPEVTYEMFQDLKKDVEKLKESEADAREWRGRVDEKLDTISSAINEQKTTVKEAIKELQSTVQGIASKPVQQWDAVKMIIISAIVSGVVGFLMRFFLQ